MQPPQVVSQAEWLEARKALLTKEKAATRILDQVRAERRALPWVKVEKPYVFQTRTGPKTLSELFEGRSQLFVYHNMLSPESDHICSGCSLLSDHFDAARQHFEHADLTHWSWSPARSSTGSSRCASAWAGAFNWVSSYGTDFNYDFGVSFTAEQLRAGPVEYNFEKVPMRSKDMHGEGNRRQRDGGGGQLKERCGERRRLS